MNATLLRLVGMCGFVTAGVWSWAGVSAGLAAVGVSFGLMDLLADDSGEDGQ